VAAAPNPLISKSRRWSFAAAPFAAVCAVVFVWLAVRQTETQPQYRLTQLTRDAGLSIDPALSPDGELLAFASDRAGEGNLDIWVKQVAGGEPIRLTSHPTNDRNPSFSPDGGHVVFRSDRDSGGIYVVPALGGQERLLAQGGYFPRYSPTGRWVAYSTGDFATESALLVVPSVGGEPREIRTGLGWASVPVWSPDGGHVLFAGHPEGPLGGPHFQGQVDWWVVATAGGDATPIGADSVLRRAGIQQVLLPTVATGYFHPPQWAPEGGFLLLSGRSGDATNLWRVGIERAGRRLSGTPQRLTGGTAELRPSIAAGGRIAFSTLELTSDLWGLPLDANRGKTLGEPRRITHDLAANRFPTVSADGRKLAFTSNRGGHMDVWIRELGAGRQYALTPSTPDRDRAQRAHLSPDGSRVAYSRPDGGKVPIYLVASGGGPEEKVCEDCGAALDWSADGRRLLYWYGNPIREAIFDLAARKRQDVVTHRKYHVYSGKMSPDDRWIAFSIADAPGSSPSFIAPVRDGGPAPESEWIPIANSRWLCRFLWSPDGGLLYYLSRSDGFDCIWAQRLDRVTKRPLGQPFAVHHIHDVRYGLIAGQFGAALTNDTLYFSLEERTGNLWLAEPQ
jgi:Tol biopolymer transport system component